MHTEGAFIWLGSICKKVHLGSNQSRFFLIVDGIVGGFIRKPSLANLIKIRILKGGEYSEVESRKSDQNQHLEGGRVFVHIRVKKSTPSLRYKILK